jgi:hypothetical protein
MTDILFIAWDILWIIGVVIAYGKTGNHLFNDRTFKTLRNPEDSFNEFKENWYVDFDSEWENIVKKRRFEVKSLVIASFASWLIFVFKQARVPGYRWRMNPLPDKEKFRSFVEMSRLMDPKWQSSNIKLIRKIRDERLKSKNN